MSTLTAKAPKKWLIKGHSLKRAAAGGPASGTALASTVNTIENYLSKANAVNTEWFEGLIGAVGLPPDHRAPASSIQNRPLTINNGKKSRKRKLGSKERHKPAKKSSKSLAVAREPPFEVPFDGLIFMGDLNYRVDYPRRLIEAYIKKVHSNTTLDDSVRRKKLDAILRHDQLRMERAKGRVFAGFAEAPVLFPPTFKYDVGSDQFDSSEKKRCPAWTDRILYCTRHTSSPVTASGTLVVRQDAYYSIHSKHSDHRPVCAHFSIFF